LGFRAVRRFGALNGLSMLRRRLYLCGVAYRRYASPPKQIQGQLRKRPHRSQRGDCDPGCDLPCDIGGKSCLQKFDFIGCCDCGGCDWPDRKRKNASQEEYVHIPPRRT
ncbi:hypothetical protein, partial [Noviherbaspirillum sp.]|uniref:hypothetical protein n=1 Tax=Noviherbaspirillum sp. TaxID=1926288 RepID=UPI003FA5C174